MFIVDADVHVNDTPGELVPYCDQPWRASLESLAQSSYPYLLVPGFAPNFRPDPPIPGGQDFRSVNTAADMRRGLDELGIDVLDSPSNGKCHLEHQQASWSSSAPSNKK